MMGDKLKNLARRFSMRTDRMKEKVIQPATPSTTEKEREDDDQSGCLKSVAKLFYTGLLEPSM